MSSYTRHSTPPSALFASSDTGRDWDVLAQVLDDDGEPMAALRPRNVWPALIANTAEAVRTMQERLSIPQPQRFLELRFGDAVVRKVPVLGDEVSGDLVFPPWDASQSTENSARPPSSTEPQYGLDILINAEMTLDNIGAGSVSDGNARSDPARAMMVPLIRGVVALHYMRLAREESFLEVQDAVDNLPLDTCIKLSSDLPDNQTILFSTLEGVEAGLRYNRLSRIP